MLLPEMTLAGLILMLPLAALLLVPAFRRSAHILEQRERIEFFHEREESLEQEPEAIRWKDSEALLKKFSDKLGRAGYILPSERKKALSLGFFIISLFALATPVFGYRNNWGIAACIGLCVVGSYAGTLVCLAVLRYKTADYEREVLFQMPIFLEELVLLVESGLGVMPALAKVVNSKFSSANVNPVVRLFQLVHQFSSSGMPFTQSLETVSEASPHKIVRHVLLHLDITGNEGGELVPSLRSLSDHAHSEWKLSVENRVRRLENFVVFPVFASVMGLMALTAAVPIVPLFDLKEKLKVEQKIPTNGINLEQPEYN